METNHWTDRAIFLTIAFVILITLFSCLTTEAADVSDVCPPGDIKYEAGKGFEYGSEYGMNVLVSGALVRWAIQDGRPERIGSICVKAGETTCTFFFPGAGAFSGETWAPSGKDISHVVFTFARPTAVTLRYCSATSSWWDGVWDGFLAALARR